MQRPDVVVFLASGFAFALALSACESAKLDSPCGDLGEARRLGGALYCLYTAQDVISAGGTIDCPAEAPFILENEGAAVCSSPYVVTCTARSFATLMYLNYRISGLDNLAFRAEFYNDMQGQRTGTRTRYTEFGIGWQHWFSPQVELRPEVTYYRSLDANAFNGNTNALIPPNRNYSVVGAMDLIWHF